MIVIVEDDVFASHAGLAIHSLFYLGFEGRHLVQVEPAYAPMGKVAVNQWLSDLDELSREQAEFVLDLGVEQAVKDSPPDVTIRIAEIESVDWTVVPPRLPLKDALRLLHQPLRLLVEDQQSDGAFLKTSPPSPWRRKLQDLLRREWIKLDHGGGSAMKARLQGVNQEETLRLWALFDSDSLEPGCPSKEANQKSQLCMSQGIPHHQLQRREIENYLPPQAILAWAAKSPRNVRTSRRRRAEAFAKLLPEQRHHFNMKDGLTGDRNQLGSIPGLFSDCAICRELQSGFGKDISALFQEKDFPIQEEWQRRDGQHLETLSMAQSIFRRL